MRELNTRDVFKFARILRDAGIISEIKRVYEIKADDKEEQATKRGEAILFSLLGVANEKVEAQIYDFLGGIYDMKPEEVGDLSIESQIEKFNQLIEKNNFTDFFSKVRVAISHMT